MQLFTTLSALPPVKAVKENKINFHHFGMWAPRHQCLGSEGNAIIFASHAFPRKCCAHQPEEKHGLAQINCISFLIYEKRSEAIISREVDCLWSKKQTRWKFCKYWLSYLEHEDLAGGPVDVELAVGRVVRVDTLPGEEVHDVLGPILIAVSGSHLFWGWIKGGPVACVWKR